MTVVATEATAFLSDPAVHGALAALGIVLVIKLWPMIKAKLEAFTAKTKSTLDDEALKIVEKIVDERVTALTQKQTETKIETEGKQ